MKIVRMSVSNASVFVMVTAAKGDCGVARGLAPIITVERVSNRNQNAPIVANTAVALQRFWQPRALIECGNALRPSNDLPLNGHQTLYLFRHAEHLLGLQIGAA